MENNEITDREPNKGQRKLRGNKYEEESQVSYSSIGGMVVTLYVEQAAIFAELFSSTIVSSPAVSILPFHRTVITVKMFHLI